MAKAVLSPKKQKHKRRVKKNVRVAERRKLENKYHISRMKTAFKKLYLVLKKEGPEQHLSICHYAKNLHTGLQLKVLFIKMKLQEEFQEQLKK